MDFLVAFAFYIPICICADDGGRPLIRNNEILYHGSASIELALENANIFDYLPIEEADSDFSFIKSNRETFVMASTEKCLSVHKKKTLILAPFNENTIQEKCTPIKYISGNLYFKIRNDYYLPRYKEGKIKFKNKYREVAKFNIKQRVPNPRISEAIFEDRANSITIKTTQNSSEFGEKDLIFEIDLNGENLGFIEPSETEKMVTLNGKYTAQDDDKKISATLRNGNYRSFTQTFVVNSPPLFCDGVSLRDAATGRCVNCAKNEGIKSGNNCYSCQPNQVLRDDECHNCNNRALANRLKNLCVCTNENEVSLGLKKNCFECKFGTKANAEKNTCMCPEYKVWSDAEKNCACEPGYNEFKEQCVVCKDGKIFDKIQGCVCEGNKVWSESSKNCVCEGNKVWSESSKNCVCEGNKVWSESNKTCMCLENEKWSVAESKCICKENYVLNEINEKCIKQQKKSKNTQSVLIISLTLIALCILVGVILFFVYLKLFRKDNLKNESEMPFKISTENYKKNSEIFVL